MQVTYNWRSIFLLQSSYTIVPLWTKFCSVLHILKLPQSSTGWTVLMVFNVKDIGQSARQKRLSTNDKIFQCSIKIYGLHHEKMPLWTYTICKLSVHLYFHAVQQESVQRHRLIWVFAICLMSKITFSQGAAHYVQTTWTKVIL